MSIALRTFLENLLTGASGTTRTMAVGRFQVVSPDAGTLEQQPDNVAERRVEVVIDSPTPLSGWNSLDNFAIYTQRVTIRVLYLVTNQGGDMVEAVTENSGAGTLAAIRDRANTDTHDIFTVLQWHENYAGSDPAIISMNPDAPSGPVVRGDTAVLELPFTMVTKATVPGAYAP